tara:strand:- start:167 stop:418 length:252 start_codon:yes stop_codon:yes gene_type:complete
MAEIQSIDNEAYTQERRQQEIEQLRDMYTQTFTSENGEKVLNDLANRCHAMSTTFISGDANASAFEEGKRAVFLHIKNMINKE